jgi:hypothetical protein
MSENVTIGYKGNVITKPFSKRGVEMKKEGAFAIIAQKSVLDGLEVVFGNGTDIFPGDVVWVRGDGEKSWGKDTVKVLGQDVLVCPPVMIVAVTQQSRRDG